MHRMGDDADVVEEILKEAAAQVSQNIYDSEQSLVQWFRDQGINVNEIDKGPFQEAVKPMLTDPDQVPYEMEHFERLQAL